MIKDTVTSSVALRIDIKNCVEIIHFYLFLNKENPDSIEPGQFLFAFQ
jgi:hypothetical protein